MASNVASPYRELAYRASDGIEILLLWHQGTDELIVSVSDERSGAYFELAAGPDLALDVFNHPYAHAAFRGLPYEEASIPCWAEASTTHEQAVPDLCEGPTR
jgi:hypothetical protein